MSQLAKDQLHSFVERIERLEEERSGLAEDIKGILQEAKSQGFDVKALRAVIRLRKQDPSDRQDYESALVTYMHALGMQSSMFDMEGFASASRRDTALVEDEREAA